MELPLKYTFGCGQAASHLRSSSRHIPVELVWLSLCVRAQRGDTDFVMACRTIAMLCLTLCPPRFHTRPAKQVIQLKQRLEPGSIVLKSILLCIKLSLNDGKRLRNISGVIQIQKVWLNYSFCVSINQILFDKIIDHNIIFLKCQLFLCRCYSLGGSLASSNGIPSLL